MDKSVETPFYNEPCSVKTRGFFHTQPVQAVETNEPEATTRLLNAFAARCELRDIDPFPQVFFARFSFANPAVFKPLTRALNPVAVLIRARDLWHRTMRTVRANINTGRSDFIKAGGESNPGPPTKQQQQHSKLTPAHQTVGPNLSAPHTSSNSATGRRRRHRAAKKAKKNGFAKAHLPCCCSASTSGDSERSHTPAQVVPNSVPHIVQPVRRFDTNLLDLEKCAADFSTCLPNPSSHCYVCKRYIPVGACAFEFFARDSDESDQSDSAHYTSCVDEDLPPHREPTHSSTPKSSRLGELPQSSLHRTTSVESLGETMPQPAQRSLPRYEPVMHESLERRPSFTLGPLPTPLPSGEPDDDPETPVDIHLDLPDIPTHNPGDDLVTFTERSTLVTNVLGHLGRRLDKHVYGRVGTDLRDLQKNNLEEFKNPSEEAYVAAMDKKYYDFLSAHKLGKKNYMIDGQVSRDAILAHFDQLLPKFRALHPERKGFSASLEQRYWMTQSVVADSRVKEFLTSPNNLHSNKWSISDKINNSPFLSSCAQQRRLLGTGLGLLACAGLIYYNRSTLSASANKALSFASSLIGNMQNSAMQLLVPDAKSLTSLNASIPPHLRISHRL